MLLCKVALLGGKTHCCAHGQWGAESRCLELGRDGRPQGSHQPPGVLRAPIGFQDSRDLRALRHDQALAEVPAPCLTSNLGSRQPWPLTPPLTEPHTPLTPILCLLSCGTCSHKGVCAAHAHLCPSPVWTLWWTLSTTQGSGTCPHRTGCRVEPVLGSCGQRPMRSAAVSAKYMKVNVATSLMAHCAIMCNINLKINYLTF